MIYHSCENNSRYKVISVTVDDSRLCIRAFTPAFIYESCSSFELILSTASVKHECFMLDSGRYLCSHEYIFEKNNRFQKAGNHVVFYTSLLSQHENEIYVDLIENIKSTNGITVIAELLCHDENELIGNSDIHIHSEVNGWLYTNIPQHQFRSLNKGNFGFRCTLTGPMSVKTNEVFSAKINMRSYSDNGVNGECAVESLSGYIPNRTVVLNNGEGFVKCCALFVEDFVALVFRDIQLRVKINE